MHVERISQIKFKTSMLKSCFCEYSGLYILVKDTISIANITAAITDASNDNKEVLFKNCAQFKGCISEINNTQRDNGKDIDVIMPIYN